jgi:hypothetical protein
MLAAHLDSLLFLLLVAVAVLFQFLAKAAAKTGKDQTKPTSTPQTLKPIPRAPTESDEDRIRKLLEALGQPPTSRPPPPVVPRTGIPSRPLAPVQPPMSPLSQMRREKPRKREATPKEIPPPLVRGGHELAPPNITGAPDFQVHEGPLPIASAPTFKAPAETSASVTPTIAKTEGLRADIATLLASTSGLRGAVILREILGPPRGLRRLEFIGT